MSIFFLCITSSYADNRIESDDGTRFFVEKSSDAVLSGSSSLLSFEALSELCVQVNKDLSDGLFKPASSAHMSCSLSHFSVGGSSYWGIVLNGFSTNYWYCNSSVGVFYARANTDTLLSSIEYSVTKTRYVIEMLDASNGWLGTINSKIIATNEALSKIQTSLDTYLVGSYQVLQALDASNGWLGVIRNGVATTNANLSSIISLPSNFSPSGGSSGSDLTTLESTAASIESTLSIINDKLDNTATKIENTTVNITNSNSAYNVFYVTDEDGNEHSITSVAGDSLSAGGKLLNFLYKLVVDGALSGVDGAVDGLGDFFFDSNPSGLGEGVSVWD